jgi:acetolactate synthase regulatory subunit
VTDGQVIVGEVVHEQALDQAETEARNLPAVRAAEAMVTRAEVTVEEIVEQRNKVVAVMAAVMKDNVHFGRIPGVQKPTLLKPGAEVLAVSFRLAPFYESERIWHEDGHLTVVSKVVLKHIPTGLTIAEGEGLCSSRESKYAWRKGERLCPACGQATIIKSKAEYGGGWSCWKKKGGCDAKYVDGDHAIEGQSVDKVPNPDIADTFNTVLKMSNKRGFVAAILNGTAASDVFTQDIEDTGADTGERVETVVLAPQRLPLIRDVEALLARVDTERGVEPGTTWDEARAWTGADLPEMPEADLMKLGHTLGHFYVLMKDGMNKVGFEKFAANADIEVPF